MKIIFTFLILFYSVTVCQTSLIVNSEKIIPKKSDHKFSHSRIRNSNNFIKSSPHLKKNNLENQKITLQKSLDLNQYQYNYIIQIWNDETSAWENSEKFLNLYSDNFKELESINQIWDEASGDWVNVSKFTSEYDVNGNWINFLRENWNVDKWENYFQYITSFNQQNLMIEDLLQVWNSTSAKWENYIIYKYEYDSNENNVSYLRQDWNNSTSQWINIWLHLGTFDNNNLLTQDLYQEWNSSNVWENVVLNLYTYDESFNETEKIVQTWNLESSIWENESKHNYSYVNNLNMDYYYFYWDLDIQDWIIWYRDLYSYDENENQTGYVSEDWDNQNLVWINYERAFFNFNEQNILMSELYQSWNLNLNDWINSTKIDYTLTQFPTEISEEKFALENTFELHQNYPNPFNPITKIKYSIPDNSNLQQKVVLKIYNVLGQVVKTLVNENKLSGIYEIEFNGNDMMSGIYFYKINFGSFEQTKKMILLK